MDSFKQNKNSVFSAAQCENKKYEAFGNLVSSSGPLDDNREFTGKEKDPTGFHYFGARYYSGDIGRFLTPDPHTLYPGNLRLMRPQSLNPYVYSRNDPINRIDIDGLIDYNIRVVRNYIFYSGLYSDNLRITTDDKTIFSSSFRVNSQTNVKGYLSIPSDVLYSGVFTESGTFGRINKGFPLYVSDLGTNTTKVTLPAGVTQKGKDFKDRNLFHFGSKSKGCILFMSPEDEDIFYAIFEDYDEEEDNIYIMFTEDNTLQSLVSPADHTGGYYDHGIYHNEHGLFTAEY